MMLSAFSLRPARRSATLRLCAFLVLLVSGSGAARLPVAAASAPTAVNRKLYFPIILRQPSPHIWISIGELSQLPASGPAWNNLKERADEVADTPNLGDQDNEVNITILAKALVFARTGQAGYRSDVVAALRVIATHNTENSDSNPMLSVSRQLVAYVISADLVSLPEYDPSLDAQFRAKLRELLTENFDSDPGDVDTLQTMHERRPNNWGTHAGASRAALAIYLGDAAELERTAQVFKGWLGDRSAYAGFHFNDDLSWQADPNNPVAVNPLGAVIQGFPVDGAMPDEMRRGCSFQWPPCYTHYAWGGLQGAVVQAEILSRAGYPVWQWQDSAMLRAVQFLYLINWPATDDDQWQPWIINHAYGAAFPVNNPVRPGKNMGWTDWTHSAYRP